MKNKMIVLAVALLTVSGTSFAQETATATATATIVTPLSISKDVNMNFGNVAVQAATSGTVVLAPDGSRSVTDGATLPVVPGTVTAASFTIEGEVDYLYTVTLPSADVTLSDGASHTMTVNVFTSDPAGNEGVLTLGTQTLNVGATLNVAAGQTAGTYVSSSFNVTVNYN